MSGKPQLVDIACGPTHSAALTASGQLYVWGCCAPASSPSASCKLSHPLLISPSSSRFVQVACGSGDCALLLLYASGLRWSFLFSAVDSTSNADCVILVVMSKVISKLQDVLLAPLDSATFICDHKLWRSDILLGSIDESVSDSA